MKHTCNLGINLFWQAYGDDIDELPEVIASNVGFLQELLHHSIAPATAQKYKYHFSRWAKCALRGGLETKDILPAKPFPVAVYLSSLIQNAQSPSPVFAAYDAIKWYDDIYGLKCPADSRLVCNVVVCQENFG